MYTPQDCADQFDAWAGVATTKSYASPEDADWCRGRADAFSDAAGSFKVINKAYDSKK